MASKVPSVMPTTGVPDVATRRVLDSIVQVLTVRSGNVGQGENQWLTKEDVVALLQTPDVVRILKDIVSR